MMDGNKDEVRELAFMLFDLGPQMIDGIELSLQDAKWIEAGNIAHKLKSTLKLWQMNDLVPLAFFIEDNGRKQENTSDILVKFSALKDGFYKAIEEMKLEFN